MSHINDIRTESSDFTEYTPDSPIKESDLFCADPNRIWGLRLQRHKCIRVYTYTHAVPIWPKGDESDDCAEAKAARKAKKREAEEDE